MSIHQPLKPENQPHENYALALKGIADLASVTVNVGRHIHENWRELEIEFGGRIHSMHQEGMNLKMNVRLGLINKGAIDCEVSIGIGGHNYAFTINTGDMAGFNPALLSPKFPAQYADYLQSYYPDQIEHGFGFMYQYSLINSENALVDFWQTLNKNVATELEKEINLHQYDNPLNSVTKEVIRLTVSLCLSTLLTNYFFNTRGHGEETARDNYIMAYAAETGQRLRSRDVFTPLDLAYINEAKRFAYKAQPIDYKGADDALRYNQLLASSNLGRMYHCYLRTVPGIRIHPETGEIIPPRIEQAALHNYNPAFLLALIENLWYRIESGHMPELKLFNEKVDYVTHHILGYMETVAFQNSLLTEPSTAPVAMEMDNSLIRGMFTEAIQRYLVAFKH